LIRGYSRRIGFLVKKGNPKKITGFKDLTREDVIFVNRIKGSGTRTLIDMKLQELLGKANPIEHVKGYDYEVKTHSAVASAIVMGRADVGIAIEPVAEMYGLDFIPVGEEIYDFIIPRTKLDKKIVKEFLKTLSSEKFAEKLEKQLKGYKTMPDTGKEIC